jgi:hypothetical protein
MDDKELPPYVEKIMKALAFAHLEPGTIQMINVSHDSWCDLLKHKGPCNCNPEVHIPTVDN